MDLDLRTLERRAADDPDLLPLLRHARERAGLGPPPERRWVEELRVAADDGRRAAERWHARRRREAEVRLRALRRGLAGAFDDHPGLVELSVRWQLVERRDCPPWLDHSDAREIPPGAWQDLRALHGRNAETAFGRFLGLRHGAVWTLIVRRDGERVVEQLHLCPEPQPPE